MTRNSPWRLLFLLGAILLFVHGCGKKTMPVPPQGKVPDAIGDLAFSPLGNGMRLSWSYPQKTVDGELLESIESFQLFRAEIPEADYCAGCPTPFDLLVKIKGGVLPRDGKIPMASYVDSDLRQGYYYIYKVNARTGWWGSSEDSNVIRFAWQPANPKGQQGH
jgi:hypothetical protein